MAGRIFLLAILGAATALTLSMPVRAEEPVTVAVQAAGNLPGFRDEDVAPFLAAQMAAAGIPSWHFVAPNPGAVPPDRIEWKFELLPYAGGEVRRFFPMPERQGASGAHLQGMHRLISAQVRLFLGGQYQTATLGEQAIQGGAGDPDLTAFVIQITRNLENGYRAIDMTPAVRSRPTP